MAWEIEYYEENSNIKVLDFLNSLKHKNRKLYDKTLNEIDLLEEHGTALGLPHVKFIEDGIWELRSRQSTNITRIFFFKIELTYVLLHGIIKKRQGLYRRDIERAKKYRDSYIREVSP